MKNRRYLKEARARGLKVKEKVFFCYPGKKKWQIYVGKLANAYRESAKEEMITGNYALGSNPWYPFWTDGVVDEMATAACGPSTILVHNEDGDQDIEGEEWDDPDNLPDDYEEQEADHWEDNWRHEEFRGLFQMEDEQWEKSLPRGVSSFENGQWKIYYGGNLPVGVSKPQVERALGITGATWEDLDVLKVDSGLQEEILDELGWPWLHRQSLGLLSPFSTETVP